MQECIGLLNLKYAQRAVAARDTYWPKYNTGSGEGLLGKLMKPISSKLTSTFEGIFGSDSAGSTQTVQTLAVQDSVVSPSGVSASGAKKGTAMTGTSPWTTSTGRTVTVNFLPISNYHRPGDKLTGVKRFYIHYTASPNGTASGVRSYWVGVSRYCSLYSRP